jgi:uncharacterized membrane protein
MDTITIIEVMQLLGDYLSAWAVPVAVALGAFMEWFKTQNKENGWFEKKWYPVVAAVIAVPLGIIISIGFPWWAYVAHIAGIYLGEVAISAGIIHPFLPKKD